MDFWVIFHGLRPTEVYCIILYFLLFTHFPNPNVAHIFVSQLELHLSWRVVIGMWGKAREGDHHTVHTVHSTTQAHRHTWLHLSTASSSASSFLSSPLPSLLSFHCHHCHFLCFSPPSSSATSSTSPPLKKWEFLWCEATANSCTWDPVLHLSYFLSVAMMMLMTLVDDDDISDDMQASPICILWRKHKRARGQEKWERSLKRTWQRSFCMEMNVSAFYFRFFTRHQRFHISYFSFHIKAITFCIFSNTTCFLECDDTFFNAFSFLQVCFSGQSKYITALVDFLLWTFILYFQNDLRKYSVRKCCK